MPNPTPEEMRELDARVAVEVMGWVIHHRNTAHWAPKGYGIGYRPCASTCSVDRWAPTEKSADAWQVMEKAGLSLVKSEDGWYAIKPNDIQHGCLRGTDHNTIVLVGNEGEQFEPQETAQLAIVLAALSASNSQTKEG